MSTRRPCGRTALTLITALAASCGGGALMQPGGTPPRVQRAEPRPEPEAHHAAPGGGYYAVPSEDHGALQSPVNIVRGEMVPGHHATALHYLHARALCVKNTGHSVEVDFPEGSTLEYDGKIYRLVQAHFHTPSEHQVDGITYPMEMHIVHARTPAAKDAPPEYLVVSVMFRMGAPNAFIAGFLDAVPARGGDQADLTHAHVFIDELFPEGKLPLHFHYRGSLTTPPYTETVEWLVLEQDLEASPQQIRRINTLEGNNARHVHALHGRTVEEEP